MTYAVAKINSTFSKLEDSGACVIASNGRIYSLLTSGDRITKTLDVTYLTSIVFIIMRMKQFGFTGNFFPLTDDIA